MFAKGVQDVIHVLVCFSRGRPHSRSTARLSAGSRPASPSTTLATGRWSMLRSSTSHAPRIGPPIQGHFVPGVLLFLVIHEL